MRFTIEPVFDSILSNLPSIEVISVLLDEVYEFNDSNLLSTPSTKCVEPVSNVILTYINCSTTT